jgi:hypothetical protein
MVGSWADWVTAGTASLALIVATAAGVATWKTNKAQQETLELQRQQFEAAREQLERAQAAKVTYLLSSDLAKKLHSHPAWPGKTADEPKAGVALAVINASDTPIYMLTLMEGSNKPRLLHAEGVLFPTGPTPEPLATDIKVDWPETSRRLYFEDSSGIAWIREVSGKLRKASNGEIATVLTLQGITEDVPGDQARPPDN